MQRDFLCDCKQSKDNTDKPEHHRHDLVTVEQVKMCSHSQERSDDEDGNDSSFDTIVHLFLLKTSEQFPNSRGILKTIIIKEITMKFFSPILEKLILKFSNLLAKKGVLNPCAFQPLETIPTGLSPHFSLSGVDILIVHYCSPLLLLSKQFHPYPYGWLR
jgi:hypothetical protein